MKAPLRLHRHRLRHGLNCLFGGGMAVSSLLTIRHFFAANFSTSLFEGSFCDINNFFNCDSSAYSAIAQIGGVPLGYFGLFLGACVMLGSLFPSEAFERTNRFLSALNLVGVVALFLFSVLHLGSLCLLCFGYYVFSLASFLLYWRTPGASDAGSTLHFWRPSLRHLLVSAVVMLMGAYGFSALHQAKREAQGGESRPGSSSSISGSPRSDCPVSFRLSTRSARPRILKTPRFDSSSTRTFCVRTASFLPGSWLS